MSFSQDYYPLVGENKVWNVLNVYNNSIEPPFDTGYITITYKISGDSVIDNVSYKKIYRTEEEFPVNWTFIRLIREDENKRVYLRMFNEDILYYDFSVEPGDTVTIGYNIYQVTLIADSVSYVEINGMLLKKIWLSYEEDPTFREFWIEGIGSNRGLLQIGTANYNELWYWFSCLTENGTLVYMNPAIQDCYMFGTGTNETVVENRITLFPNPASTFITLVAPRGQEIEKIIFYNQFGQVVLSVRDATNPINISNLIPGIYFAAVSTSGRKLMTKVFIE